MNIIFLINSPFPYYTGGRETWLYNVAQRLCQDHSVYILTETPWFYQDNGRFPDLDSRVRFLRAKDMRNNPVLRHVLRSYMNALNERIMLWSMWKQLSALLESLEGESCFVISMDTVYTGRLGIKAKQKYPHVRYISSVRCKHAIDRGERFPLLKNYYHSMERKSLSAADRIWSNGWDTKEFLYKQGFSSIVMKNGIDVGRAKHPLPAPPEMFPAKGDFRILTVGTLQDAKGCRELIQAVGILKREYGLAAGVTFFGKGNPKRYRLLARQEGVEDQVCFAGIQPLTVEYASSFDLAACLGFSAQGSGLSMACLESLLSGTPVIAWDGPAYSQMIAHGENGWLVKEKDTAALAEGIFWLSEHREEARDMGEKACASVGKFDWSYIIKDIVESLEGIDR